MRKFIVLALMVIGFCFVGCETDLDVIEPVVVEQLDYGSSISYSKVDTVKVPKIVVFSRIPACGHVWACPSTCNGQYDGGDGEEPFDPNACDCFEGGNCIECDEGPFCGCESYCPVHGD